jgi:hypothetical protein
MNPMSLVELPANTGKVFAVNPHHVTAVAPYSGQLAGKSGMHDISAVYVRNPQGPTAVYICAWSVEDTLDALNTARTVDMEAFQAGFRACDLAVAQGEVPSMKHMADAFRAWVGVSANV